MEIKIKQLKLKNFKGIKELEVNFSDVTSIKGANATGKTTIVDAFTWLIFGKDSKDRKDFNIKTLDSNGNEYHGLEHSVTGVLEINGQQMELQKIYKEKWTKTRGQAKKELKGHTTDFYINEIPVKQKEYQDKINSIFEENKFKLLTNPLYFPNMNWKDQRKMLLEIIGDISDKSVIAYNSKLKPLESELTDGIDNFNKKIAAKIKKCKDDIKSLPYRIDECNNNIIDVDFVALKHAKCVFEKQLSDIEQMMIDKSKVNEEKYELKSDLNKLKYSYSEKINTAKMEARKPLMEINNRISSIKNEIDEIQSSITSNDRRIRFLKSDIQDLKNEIDIKENMAESKRREFKNIKAEKFEVDRENFICPTCKRKLEENDIDAKISNMEYDFKVNQGLRIDKVRLVGKKLVNEIAAAKEEIKEKENNIQSLVEDSNLKSSKLESLDVDLSNAENELKQKSNISEVKFEGQAELENQIAALEDKINNFAEADLTTFRVQKKDIQDKISNIDKQLAAEENNEKLKVRIAELEAEDKELGVKIAALEGQQYLGEEFVRTKVELLEKSINDKFKGIVTFKLFNNQINGGLNETCEAEIEGVPFSNANTAAQINAGLSIINTLCNHFNATAPIFVDNAEAVNVIGKTESQLIKLIVSNDNQLVIDGYDVATNEEIEEFKIKFENFDKSDYSTGYTVEDYFEDFEIIEDEYGEKSRWSITRYMTLRYKNIFLYANWEEPATEMQEGQDTMLELSYSIK